MLSTFYIWVMNRQNCRLLLILHVMVKVLDLLRTTNYIITLRILRILRLAKHRHIQYNKYLTLNSRSPFFHFPKRESRKKF